MFKCMVKTITIMDDAYNLLRKMKSENESFSDVIRKCAINKSTDIKKWVGVLGKDENRTKEFRKSIMDIRQPKGITYFLMQPRRSPFLSRYFKIFGKISITENGECLGSKPHL